MPAVTDGDLKNQQRGDIRAVENSIRRVVTLLHDVYFRGYHVGQTIYKTHWVKIQLWTTMEKTEKSASYARIQSVYLYSSISVAKRTSWLCVS